MSETSNRPGSRVLVVVGESACRSFVARTLESVLLNVDTAARYEEALEHLRARAYAVLVIDPSLPRVDGVELMKKIHDEQPDLIGRSIVIAEPDSAIAERIPGSQPLRKIQKPVLRHELIQAVSECLREPSS